MIFEARPPAWVDAVWWDVYGPELRDPAVTGNEWTDRLAWCWGLVRSPEAAAAGRARSGLAQAVMVDRLLQREFLTTQPGAQWKLTMVPELPPECRCTMLGWGENDQIGRFYVLDDAYDCPVHGDTDDEYSEDTEDDYGW